MADLNQIFVAESSCEKKRIEEDRAVLEMGRVVGVNISMLKFDFDLLLVSSFFFSTYIVAA